MSEQIKDKLFGFESVKVGENSKGGVRTQLYLSSEDAIEFAETLVEKAQAGTGVKIDVHQAERVNKQNGRTFLTAFAFIKEKQDAPQGGFGKPSPKKVASKDTPDQLKDRINKLKSKQVEA